MSNIASILRAFIRENFLYGSETTFSDDDSFLEFGLIDSTGVLELVAFLEKRFHVRIADDDLVPNNLDSINNLVRFIEARLSGAPEALPRTTAPVAVPSS